MYKTILLPAAKQDIKEAAKWYEKRQKGLGKRFTAEVRQRVNFIKKAPLAASNRYNEIRTAVLDIFPFMIHFFISEDKKTLVITAVLHTSRNPDLWNERERDIDDD